ncbi:COPII subunit, partial [Spiromyces aspiralis]
MPLQQQQQQPPQPPQNVPARMATPASITNQYATASRPPPASLPQQYVPPRLPQAISPLGNVPVSQPASFVPGMGGAPASRSYSPAPGVVPPPQMPRDATPEKPAPHRRRAYPQDISSAYIQGQTTTDPSLTAPPPPPAAAAATAAAAVTSVGAVTASSGMANGSVPGPAASQTQELFVPGNPPPITAQPNTMYTQQQVPPSYGGMGTAQAPAYGLQTGPALADMGNLAAQMGSMALSHQAQKFPVVHVNRIEPADFELPPPPIELPEGSTAVITNNAICPPIYKCSTLNAVPKTDKILKKTKLPFGLIITPFKTRDEGEADIPIVYEIVRCRRCRTYMNPFVKFTDGGRRWQCNLCNLVNDVPMLFDFDPITQQPRDRWSRAELNHSVVEFIAPAEYMIRPPMPPVYVFVIDVSYTAMQLGAPQTITQCILETLDRIPNKENRTQVAFITVDSTLHFYYMRPDQPDPQMMVVSDIDDVFLPSPNDLLVNLTECREAIETMLSRLGDMFQKTQNVSCALGPAIKAANSLLGTLGGKVIVMTSTIPSLSEGKLSPLDEDNALGTPKESDLLKAHSQWYKNIAAESSRVQIAYDTIFFGQAPKDMPSIVSLARYTGGSVFYYPDFAANRPEEVAKFKGEFSQLLANQVGLEAVLRVRASNGLTTKAYYGNFFLRSMDLLALPNVTPNHSYAVDLEISEDLRSSVVYFQTALLYTTCDGERRIRVSTLALPTTENLHTIFHHADQVAIASLLAKKAVDRALSAKLDDAREAVQYKCIEILGAFKTECTTSRTGATTDLQAPRNLQLLPFMTLSILKHASIRAADRIPVSIRTETMNFVNTMPSDQLVLTYLVPRLYSLHDMSPECGYPDKETGIVVLPPRLLPTAERLAINGVYLLYDGHDCYLIFGRAVAPEVYHSLLNIPDAQSLTSGIISFPDLSEGGPQFELNRRTLAILRRLR